MLEATRNHAGRAVVSAQRPADPGADDDGDGLGHPEESAHRHRRSTTRGCRRKCDWGYRIFTNTPVEAKRFTPSKMSCNNCHANAGQRERALPLVGVAGQFPEYNRRAGRLITLADRIVDCFLRSENATGRTGRGTGAVPD